MEVLGRENSSILEGLCLGMMILFATLPETNIAHENPIFPGKYHQNGGFSMAMLVSGSVVFGDNEPTGESPCV